MKKSFIVLAVALFLMAGFGIQASAQQLKIGYIKSDELLQAMPERDSIQAKIDKETKEASDRYEEMNVEYNNKLDKYVQRRDSLSRLIRQEKEAELAEIENRIRTFQNAAQQSLQQRQQELLQPLFTKIQNAIKAVAEENKFTYILDVSTGVALYFPEGDTSLNVMALVKAKLGLK